MRTPQPHQRRWKGKIRKDAREALQALRRLLNWSLKFGGGGGAYPPKLASAANLTAMTNAALACSQLLSEVGPEPP